MSKYLKPNRLSAAALLGARNLQPARRHSVANEGYTESDHALFNDLIKFSQSANGVSPASATVCPATDLATLYTQRDLAQFDQLAGSENFNGSRAVGLPFAAQKKPHGKCEDSSANTRPEPSNIKIRHFNAD